ncbi:MAG: hypothetical protein NC304_12925, partial [Robinsoniella sp.]|nr:hypothetical protein [Robinsoniella sp.]
LPSLSHLPLSANMYTVNPHIRPAIPSQYTQCPLCQRMSRVEIDAELMKGIDSLKSGKTYTADEVDAELAKEFDV